MNLTARERADIIMNHLHLNKKELRKLLERQFTNAKREAKPCGQPKRRRGGTACGGIGENEA